jgi:exonuclease VII large subunit
MGCAAEIIALDDVRTSQQRQALRQHLHERFDQWLDEVETQLPEANATLAQVSETIWSLRQGLTAGVAQTLMEQSHPEERGRQSLRCPTCDRLLSARPAVSRTVRTLVLLCQILSEHSSLNCSVVIHHTTA